MKYKVQQKNGFTLAELLIVVAIIAILIAIMVPVFGASRADAIEAKDAANLRSAYAEAVTTAMSTKDYADGKLNVDLDKVINDNSIKFDSKTTAKKDGAGTGTITIKTSGSSSDEKGEIIYYDNDEVTLKFEGLPKKST